ncbi:acyltransferase [Streptococcus suis]|nr:acyltransferase [Streptococcus suis]NQI37966.1 acyltransferase [Streptococcus suis]NQI48971.1 acyltransferase [Streptococcus suis]NQO19666.1 acyltransferase [Streptococcus suis]NQO24053.1 acyltransferase [Streptococcus suis]
MMIKKLVKKILRTEANQMADIDALRRTGIRIGNNCEIYDQISFGSEPYLITIGDHVRITKGCKFITHDGGIWVLRHLKDRPDLDLFGSITVGNNVHIGMNAVIMPGVRIGDNCIIGCGAVVTHDVPSGEIWGGVPARCIKTIDEYYSQHLHEFDETKQMSVAEKESYLKEKYKM